MKISICDNCELTSKIKHKHCPLCFSKMRRSDGRPYTVRENIVNNNRNVFLFYTCVKCKREMEGKICLLCNKVGLLTISYNGKTEIVKRLNYLSDKFTNEEIKEILSQLNIDEKHLIYRNLASTKKLENKKDPMKASVSFFVALLIYITCLEITIGSFENEVYISYISNTIGNGIFSIFILLGLLYLFNASKIEKEFTVGKIGLVSGILHFIYIIILIFFQLQFKPMLILGFIFIGLTFIISQVVMMKRGKNA
ncbi:MAG TPA: hypothetical protein GXZ48_06565 [Acholeplasmataceae bacterium]|nr:hypothetical protein [Acholeplasmataceae bacterium]